MILATFEDSQPLDQVAFNLSLFPDQRYEEIPGGSAPWRLLAHAGGASMPFAAAADNKVLLDRGQAWEAFVGHYALHRLLRMQSDMLFFHAASAGIGAAGVLIAGPEKSGKTTLSTTLASRGHAFLGDDLAGVRRSSGELVPLRRSASIRPGPRAPGMTELLERGQYREEVYADGETRVRARIGDLFPSAGAAPIPLHSVFFLRGGFGDRPSVKAFVAGPQHARWLTPLGSTLWGVPAGVRMMDFMRLLSRAHCYFLEPGGAPEETAQLVESTVKEKAWG
ncbi:MAG: hypothetical protein HYR60_07685 [Acidobacteria bacterium]|nr:hypothetical protein [Acidobacteriota bacterium]